MISHPMTLKWGHEGEGMRWGEVEVWARLIGFQPAFGNAMPLNPKTNINRILLTFSIAFMWKSSVTLVPFSLADYMVLLIIFVNWILYCPTT
jgi:hypothetical protein